METQDVVDSLHKDFLLSFTPVPLVDGEYLTPLWSRTSCRLTRPGTPRPRREVPLVERRAGVPQTVSKGKDVLIPL